MSRTHKHFPPHKFFQGPRIVGIPASQGVLAMGLRRRGLREHSAPSEIFKRLTNGNTEQSHVNHLIIEG